MDKSNLNQPETEDETRPEAPVESVPEVEIQSDPATDPVPVPETGTTSYINERIMHAYERSKAWFRNGKERYLRSPRLQKVTYQGKFLPAFWTVTAVFSLLVNIILVVILALFGRYFLEFKNLVADTLVNGVSSNLALMDKAHIVTTVPVATEVQLQDSLPVAFDLPINQYTQVTLAQSTRISNAYIYLNNTAVTTDLTLPAGTPLNFALNTTVPVSQSIPVNLSAPVSLQVPLDIAVDQTDLHQSIVGMQDAIEPYRVFMDSTLDSSTGIPLCGHWWSGWLCKIFLGKQ
jgi:hypothetical protein